MNRKCLLTGLGAALVVAAALVTGCIISGQFIVVYAGTDTIHSQDADVDPLFVDVTQEDIWQDHHEDIQSIVDIKFECTFINNDQSNHAHGELWISENEYATVGDVRENATRVFSGLEVEPGESAEVSFSESSAYIENLDMVLDLLEDGSFWIYGIVPEDDEPMNLTIGGVGDKPYARFMITFSAGS